MIRQAEKIAAAAAAASCASAAGSAIKTMKGSEVDSNIVEYKNVDTAEKILTQLNKPLYITYTKF